MAHILLSRDFDYKKRKEIIPPANYFYDKFWGAWLSLDDNRLLINDSSFPAIATKKKDIETGEDAK